MKSSKLNISPKSIISNYNLGYPGQNEGVDPPVTQLWIEGRINEDTLLTYSNSDIVEFTIGIANTSIIPPVHFSVSTLLSYIDSNYTYRQEYTDIANKNLYSLLVTMTGSSSGHYLNVYTDWKFSSSTGIAHWLYMKILR